MKKEYLTLSKYLKQKFGERVQRIPLDPGFSCPVRNGGRKSDGCIYCDSRGSGAPWLGEGMKLSDQFKTGAEIARRRYRAKKFIAYFQSFTTTHADLDALGKLYQETLSYEGVVGMAVSTRPDCIGNEVLDLLEEFSRKTYLWIELGAQSMNDKSLDWIRRGHTSQVFADAVSRIRSRNIESAGHIIFGLPCETREETLDSYKKFLDTGVQGIKIHALHVIKDTVLGQMYEKDPFRLLSKEEYIELVREALDRTPSDRVLHRLTGETDRKQLIAPLWVLDKTDILQKILA